MAEDKIEELWREFAATHMTGWINEALAKRLLWCADRYELDTDSLLKWTELALMTNALIENVENGSLDIAGLENGEYQFQNSEQGSVKAEEILNQTPEGAALVRAMKEQHAADERVLDADEIG